MPDLTPAQRRVLVALCSPALDRPFAAPASNAEIAAALFVTVDTVKSHLHAMFELFGIDGMPQNRKRAELVRLALERGVVSG
jgi:DNA-binding NarL/FixJ family response regulator